MYTYIHIIYIYIYIHIQREREREAIVHSKLLNARKPRLALDVSSHRRYPTAAVRRDSPHLRCWAESLVAETSYNVGAPNNS